VRELTTRYRVVLLVVACRVVLLLEGRVALLAACRVALFFKACRGYLLSQSMRDNTSGTSAVPELNGWTGIRGT